MTGLIIAGAIVLGVIGLFLLLLLCPVKLTATYRDTIRLVVSYGPIRIPLYPGKELSPAEKAKKAKKAKKKAARKAAKKKQAPNQEAEPKQSFLKRLYQAQGISGLLHIAAELTRLAGGTMRRVFRHMVIYHLHLQIRVGTPDAAKTAILHGRICAVLDSCAAAFSPLVRERNRRGILWSIQSDFVSEDTEIRASAQVGIRPLFLFGIGFRALYQLLKLYQDTEARKKTRLAEKAAERQAEEQPQQPEQTTQIH